MRGSDQPCCWVMVDHPDKPLSCVDRAFISHCPVSIREQASDQNGRDSVAIHTFFEGSVPTLPGSSGLANTSKALPGIGAVKN